MQNSERINVYYEPKPIPFRGCDYSAVFDWYEPGDLIGYGATEQEAKQDLLQKHEYGDI